jgi:hypothetical protein
MTEYEEYQDYDEYYGEPQSRNRTWLILGIVVIVVLLCCCCLALVAGYLIFQEDISNALSMLTGVMALA